MLLIVLCALRVEVGLGMAETQATTGWHFVSNLDLNPYSEDMTAGHVRPTLKEAALIKVAYPFTQSEFAIHMSAAANRVAFH